MPEAPADLSRHRLVHYAPTLNAQDAAWEHHDPATGRTRRWPMQAALTVNATDAYQAACLAGLGLIQAPVSGTQALVEAGRLVEVMPDCTAQPMPVSLLYASRRQLPPRVQAIMAWLAQVMDPYLADFVA